MRFDVLIRPGFGGFLMVLALGSIGACAAAQNDQTARTSSIPGTASPAGTTSPNICGINNPIRLESLSGGGDRVILLVPPALLDKGMTSPLTGWEAELRVAAIYHLDQPVTSLINASSYSCRNVRGGEGGSPARLSRHAKGLALDVSGFRLRSGQTIMVAEHWGKDTRAGRFLRAAHKAACRNFDTVLGPGYNRAHSDHFHLDMGSGSGICR